DWDSTAFHQALLAEYVKSFSLEGHGLMDCVRIFLSAFRLPGEAQQIDRILVAFSERCHAQSREGQSGLVENAEVAYLLCFSIIMLNTDRHNANIKVEKKMTLEQFIRNNLNYGKDVNQTRPLPREFLEEIYASISSQPIRTEGDEAWQAVTEEEWKDLCMSGSNQDSDEGIVSDGDDASSSLFSTLCPLKQSAPSGAAANAEQLESLLDASGSELQQQLASRVFSERAGLRPLLSLTLQACLSSAAEAQANAPVWLWDADMLRSVAELLLLPCLAVHLYNHCLVMLALQAHSESNATVGAVSEAGEPLVVRGWKERVGRLVDLSQEFFSDLLALVAKHQLGGFVDTSLALLCEVVGVCQTHITAHYLANTLSKDCTTRYLDGSSGSDNGGLAWSVQPGRFSEQIAFPSLQKSLAILLDTLSAQSGHVARWELPLLLLCTLRDHILLPAEMVQEGEGDILPPNIRRDFEQALLSLDRAAEAEAAAQRNASSKSSNPGNNTRSSFVALQMLGEALFGSSSDNTAGAVYGEEGDGQGKEEDKEVYMLLMERYNKRSSRWDAGYDYLPNLLHSKLLNHGGDANNSSGTQSGSSGDSGGKRLVWDETLR
ncbi:hypothetical protein EON64_12250, partial [archaeon]